MQLEEIRHNLIRFGLISQEHIPYPESYKDNGRGILFALDKDSSNSKDYLRVLLPSILGGGFKDYDLMRFDTFETGKVFANLKEMLFREALNKLLEGDR